jgi:hypothetical protein
MADLRETVGKGSTMSAKRDQRKTSADTGRSAETQRLENAVRTVIEMAEKQASILG